MTIEAASARSAGQGSRSVDILHPCYWPEVTRGSERIIHDLGIRLARDGYRPRLITSHPGASTAALEGGMEVLRLRRPRGRRLQLGLRSEYIMHLPRSYRALSRGDADVAHALYPSDALAATRWARRTGRPSVFSLMGVPRPESVRRPLWGRVVRQALRRADVSVCLSRYAAERTRELLGTETRVINPGVDLDQFRPTARRASQLTILCPADLRDPRKRGSLLLDAFAVVQREHKGEVRLLVSRHSAASLEAAGPRAGIEVADLDRPQTLVDAYSRAWVTVLPSRAEAFGLVLVESLACGTPVVAAADGAAEEIVGSSHEAGTVLGSTKPEEWAEALINRMVAGEDGRDACRARAARFSADRCASAYEALYRELL